jgi:hypothetical protein
MILLPLRTKLLNGCPISNDRFFMRANTGIARRDPYLCYLVKAAKGLSNK